jgi:methyl halide transferase
MTPTQAIDWEGRYQSGTTRWERPALNPAFIAWRQSAELVPCRILIPGAGRSPEPAALAADGFDVTVLDVAPSAAAAQRELLGAAASVVEADLFTWQPEAMFEAIYDQTCLCALPPALWQDYEQRLVQWLRPGGTLLVLFMQTGTEGGPPFDCPIPRMSELFATERWIWPATLPPLVHHPSLRDEQPAVLGRR